jgi:signal transduction histidine kinase
LLSPTPVEDLWVGSLRGADEEPPIRIEGAMLRAGPPGAAAAAIPKPSSVVAKVLDATPALIGIRDDGGRYAFANAALAEFFGREAEAFVGRTPEELGLSGAPKLGWSGERPARDARPWVVRDVMLVDALGRRRRFDIVRRAVRSVESGAALMLEVATETTGATGTVPNGDVEQRLADSERRLELALANGGLGLVDWRVDTDALLPNRQLDKLFELPEGERVETLERLRQFEHPKDRVRVDEELKAQLDGRTTELHCEYRIRTARGRTRWVLANGRVVERAPDGAAVRYVATLQDVTESMETEQELEKQLARVQSMTRKTTELAREVKELEAQIREISHREQERLGHDLHDGLAQELTGASLLLKSLEHSIARQAPGLTPRVRAARDMVDQCIGSTRALAQALGAVHLDRDGGFAGALEELAGNCQALYGIPVHFACSGEGPPPRREAVTDLYRIAQEAIRNAAKHSGAREISVRLDLGVARLVLTVEDDGRGMPSTQTKRSGMGLKIMHYRAAIIGAALEICPRAGGGTAVRCTLENIGHSGIQGGNL